MTLFATAGGGGEAYDLCFFCPAFVSVVAAVVIAFAGLIRGSIKAAVVGVVLVGIVGVLVLFAVATNQPTDDPDEKYSQQMLQTLLTWWIATTAITVASAAGVFGRKLIANLLRPAGVVRRFPSETGSSMTNEITGVRGGYDRWAAVYDHDANPLQALEEPQVRAAVGDVRGLNVLDLGCGTGRHSLWLAAAGASVTAVDFSEGMLAEARQKPGADAVRFVAHDLHTPLPFADASFDLVVSGLVLEHLRELDPFFAEAKRVLKSGGRAVVSAMHPAMFLRGTQARFTDPASGELVQPGSVPHSVGAFVTAAVRAGFALERVDEFAPDAEFATRFPRAEKYVDWPMLVVLKMTG